MDMLMDLWLPIVITTVVVFIASSIAWMAMPHHKADMKVLPDESAVGGVVKGLAAGSYYFPNCHNKDDMKSDDFKQRWQAGPWGMLTIPNKAPSFPISLGTIFVEFLVITVVIAYISGLALGPGAEYMTVFRVVSAAGVLGYMLGGIGGSIFMMKTWRAVIMFMLDGLVFALLTAGIFAAMWPEGASIVNDAAEALPMP